MMKLKIAAAFVATFLMSISGVYSQKESVILYNSQAVKVQLSQKGTIESFISVVPDYMSEYNIEVKPIEVIPEKIEESILPKSTAKNADYAVVSTDRVELKYKPNFATLDKSVINKLNEVAAKLKADPNAKILLTAHSTSKIKSKLTTNRLSSAIAYLGIKGILSYRIQTDIQQSENLVDVIALYYLM